MINSALPEKKNIKKIDSQEMGEKVISNSNVTGENRKGMKKERDCKDKNLRYRSLVIEATKYRTLYNREIAFLYWKL